MFGRRTLLRSVLATVAITPLLAACDLLDRDPPAPIPPDTLTDFYAKTLGLVALYSATIEGAPQLAAAITPIRAAHQAHVNALAAIMSPAPSASPATAISVAPATAAQLRQAETTAQQEAVQACVAAPTTRATLLGEIAAARACHVEVLPA